MRTQWLVGLAIVFVYRAAGAEETPTPPPEPVPTTAESGGRFAAPNGQLGAGLSFSPEQQGRVFLELGFTHQSLSESFGPATSEIHINGLQWILGGGYKVAPNLELDVMLPMAWIEGGSSTTGIPNVPDESNSDSGLAVGNLHVGVSYLHARGPLRLKGGGAIEYGPWTSDLDPVPGTAIEYGHAVWGGTGAGLWAPETLSFVAPGRIEYGDQLVLGGDAALGLHIPTDGGDTEVTVELAPGVGYYATETVLIGLRVPFTFVPTESGSSMTFLAAEPYARFDIGKAFIDARFTLNIDHPYGFSFDEGKIWGLHVGGGGSF